MTESKLYKLMDLIEEINRVEYMLEMHSQNNDSQLMLDQYNAKKLKLTRELISELLASSDKSDHTMSVIKSVLDKFYKNPGISPDNDKQSSDYKKLMEAL